MNRTAIFISVVGMVTVSIVAACVIGILAPDGFLTFTAFVGTSIIAITGFAVTLYNVVKTRETNQQVLEATKQVELQTNGRLTSRDREIARLQTALIERGHSDVVANVAATQH